MKILHDYLNDDQWMHHRLHHAEPEPAPVDTLPESTRDSSTALSPDDADASSYGGRMGERDVSVVEEKPSETPAPAPRKRRRHSYSCM